MAGDFVRVSKSLFFLPAGQTASEPVWQPPADIYKTRTGWLVKFDLAGIRPEDVKLSLNGDKLTIRGVRRDFCLEEGCCHYQMEISYSHFERCIHLPVSVDKAELTFELHQGMLLVHIKTEAAK